MSMITIGDKQFTPEELQVLSKAGVLNIGQKNDPASTTLTASTLQGPFPGNAAQFGIFSGAGVRPDRFSAMARPDSLIRTVVGLGGMNPSRYVNEILEIMTGQTAGGTTNASGFCGNPPVVGDLKVMRRVFTWGDYYVKTNLDAVPLISQLRDRADVPGNILNAGPRANPLIPDMMYRLTDSQSHLQHELFKLGVDLERTMETVAIQGVAATDNSNTGWFHEFAGLDGQIATGITDSVTGLAAPAVDSTVISFNADITGTNADGSGRNFTETITDTVEGRLIDAAKVGMEGVVLAIVMRREQFYRATQVVACQNAIYNCTGAQYEEVNRDGSEIQRQRLAMYNGQYLALNGRQVPVVFSEGVVLEGIANNTYRSDIYIVPLNWGGLPLLRLEFFPMNNPYALEFANFNGMKITVLNNGLFVVGSRDTGLCVEYHFAARFRLVLETPFLAARIDNVEYSYLLNTRTAHPGQSLHVDGGISYRS